MPCRTELAAKWCRCNMPCASSLGLVCFCLFAIMLWRLCVCLCVFALPLDLVLTQRSAAKCQQNATAFQMNISLAQGGDLRLNSRSFQTQLSCEENNLIRRFREILWSKQLITSYACTNTFCLKLSKWYLLCVHSSSLSFDVSACVHSKLRSAVHI